jgi:hypothetical protein
VIYGFKADSIIKTSASFYPVIFMKQFALSNEGSSNRMGRDRLQCSKLRIKIIPRGRIKCSAIFATLFLKKWDKNKN